MISLEKILSILPQTQCTQCGYEGCKPYAQAIVDGTAAINRCPPGGMDGVRSLSEATGQAVQEIAIECGPTKPRHIAVIDPKRCIGCTLCITACPVDAIIGAPKAMHQVINTACTGCDLCLPPCPVDCIDMVRVDGLLDWTPDDALNARLAHEQRAVRLQLASIENNARLAERAHEKINAIAAGEYSLETIDPSRKKAAIQAALDKARARRAAG